MDGDGDVDMVTAQPVYEVIAAPMLKGWDHATLVSWRRDRVQYENKIRQRCAVTGEQYGNVAATVKNSILPAVLDNLCWYVLRVDVDTVSEEELVAVIDARCRSLKNNYVPDLKALFAEHLRMDMSVDDVDARIFKYFQDFNRIVDDNGLQGMVGRLAHDKAGIKTRCALLVENLQPPMLKTKIERLVSFEKRECRVDDIKLFELIMEHAKLQHQFHLQLNELRNPRPANGAAVTRSAAGGARQAGANERRPQAQASKLKGPVQPSAQRKPAAEKPPPQGGCLACGGPHWLRHCPLPEDKKVEARAKLKAAREKRNQRVLRSGVGEHGLLEGMVQLAGVLEANYVVDSGADRTIIPAGVVECLREIDPKIELVTLDLPLSVEVADGRSIICDAEVSIGMRLMTAAGAVHVPAVKCLIMPGGGSDVLIGNDLMVSLGIDVKRMFEQLATTPVIEDEVNPFPYPDEDLPATAEVKDILDAQVADALESGLDPQYADGLRAILTEYEDTWRTELGPDPPARLEPLRIELKPDAVPYRAKPQRYAPLQSQFMRQYTSQLESYGYIKRNNMARWASPCYPVRKSGSGVEFRMTTDYRKVNSMTVPIAGTMPNLNVVLPQVSGSRAFAGFDLMKGFWQLGLHPESQEVLSIMTDDGIFTPTRVPQGARDSALHFQAQLQAALAPLQGRCLVWVDDIILFGQDDESFLATLREFFDIVRAHDLKLNAKKSRVYCREIKWCGKIVSGTEVRHDPERLSGLSNMPLPATVQELQHFLCAVGWLRDSLPDFARISLPLRIKLDTLVKAAGRRNKNALKMAVKWTAAETRCFNDIKALVASAVPLEFPSDDGDVCLFTDASMEGWSIIVTQVDEWTSDTPVHEQQHRLLVCKGGTFSGAELNWSTIEKEAFPIVKACTELEYLLLRESGFKMFCDHRNLIYIFSPDVELKQHVKDKLQRWAMRISGLQFTIEHIEGSNNVWADILSRWATLATPRALAVRTRSRPGISPLRPLDDGNFVFPSTEEVVRAQQTHRHLLRDGADEYVEVDGVIMVNDNMWVPSKATDLLQRLFIVAHCGGQGHRGVDAMVQVLSERFCIERLEARAQEFVRQCLLCKHVKGPRIIQRPWGPTFTATERNEGLHWDYLYLGEGYGDNSYVLVLKDSLTHYCELFPSGPPNSVVSAEGLVEWYKRYGSPKILVSDQGSHFRNQTIERLCAMLKTDRQFSPVYAPWVNGTVERLNKDFLQVLRVFLLEYRLDTTQWPYLLSAIQACLNHTPVESLEGYAPMELFLALPKPSALDSIAIPKDGVMEFVSIDMNKVNEWLDSTRRSLHGLHREVVDKKERKRLQQMASKRATVCNFDAGDFVLWSRVDERLPNRKLLSTWLGPFKVVETRPHSFMIEHVLTNAKYEVHGSRLKYYHDPSLGMTEELREFVSEQGIELGVESIQGHRYNEDANRWELSIKWVGLQDVENSWEGLADILESMPARTREYVQSTGDPDLISVVFDTA